VALAVLVGGGTVGGLRALGQLTATWRAELRIVALLVHGSAEAADPDALQAAVGALPGVTAVRYRSTDEALADLRRHLGPAGNGLDRLPTNPVPARLEVTPAAELRALALASLVAALARVPGVEEVQAAVGWVGEVERLERALRIGGFALAGLLALAGVLVVAGATSLARHRRADESAVLRLAGVAEARLWTPLLLQSLVQGAAGAALGVAGLLLASDAGPTWITAGLQVGLGMAPLPAPSGLLAAALLGSGLAVGLIGGLGGGRA
jgi:cell division transport system permease protein